MQRVPQVVGSEWLVSILGSSRTPLFIFIQLLLHLWLSHHRPCLLSRHPPDVFNICSYMAVQL